MNLHCWSCQEKIDIDDLDDDLLEEGCFTCPHCEEVCVIMGNRTISTDEEYEGACDSEASQRYEEAAYGHDVDDLGPNYPTFTERDD